MKPILSRLGAAFASISKWNLLGLVLIVVLIVFILVQVSAIVEPFADDSASATQDITQFMTTASECFCPATQQIVDSLIQQKQGTDEEKKESALVELAAEAGKPLFPCPPPDDPLQIPANIGDRVVTSCIYLKKKLIDTKAEIQKALDCPKKEGFGDICTPELERRRQQIEQENAAKASATSCTPKAGLTEKDKTMILQQRRDALAGVMKEFIVTQSMVGIRALTQEIKDLKSKAERGELASNCPT